jgi:hypothetical protein
MFGSKKDEVTEFWRGLHDYSGEQIKKNEIGGACYTYIGRKMRMQDFGEENWEKSRCEWEDNIEMDLYGTG